MRLLPVIVAKLVRAIGGSLRYHFILDDPRALPQAIGTRAIYTFWHEWLFLPACTHADQVVPLISRSADGSGIAEVYRMLGGRTIRGSTDHGRKNRGGATAVRQMLRCADTEHIGVPLDGPVGPRRKVSSDGVTWVASRTGMPVVPVGISAYTLVSLGAKGRKVNIPVPFGRAWFVIGAPLRVPSLVSRSHVREHTAVLQAAMDNVQSRADDFARTATTPEKALTLHAVRLIGGI